MKKIISFVLAAVLLVSAVPTALATNDYSQGTQVVYEATGSESYTITVPAQLAPGGNGTVTLSGTWADNRIVTVTADPTVTLTNSIKADDQKVLNVTFAGISEAGSNTGSQTFTEGVSVAEIENALFGTWSGKFNYNVEITTVASAHVLDGDGQTFHKMAPSTLSFRSTAPLSEFKEVKVNGETIDPSNYTLTEGSTIVTLSIDYLKTLDVAAHEITVVSESGSPSAGFSVAEPDLNEHGFYYNQPYSVRFTTTNAAMATVENYYFYTFNSDGTGIISTGSLVKGFTLSTFPSFTSKEFTYTINGDVITLDINGVSETVTITSNKLELVSNALSKTLKLDGDFVVADETYYYLIDAATNTCSLTPKDITQSQHGTPLKNINGIPVTKIADNAFSNAKNLYNFRIPDGITSVGNYAFSSCENLTSFTIPASVKSFGMLALQKCSNLTTLVFEGTVEEWNAVSFAFAPTTPLTEVICSDGTIALS